MSISFGNKNVKEMYFGNKKVAKVYFGNKLVWPPYVGRKLLKANWKYTWASFTPEVDTELKSFALAFGESQRQNPISLIMDELGVTLYVSHENSTSGEITNYGTSFFEVITEVKTDTPIVLKAGHTYYFYATDNIWTSSNDHQPLYFKDETGSSIEYQQGNLCENSIFDSYFDYTFKGDLTTVSQTSEDWPPENIFPKEPEDKEIWNDIVNKYHQKLNGDGFCNPGDAPVWLTDVTDGVIAWTDLHNYVQASMYKYNEHTSLKMYLKINDEEV